MTQLAAVERLAGYQLLLFRALWRAAQHEATERIGEIGGKLPDGAGYYAHVLS